MESSRGPVGIDVGGTKLLIIAGEHQVRLPTGPEADGAALAAAIHAELRRLQWRPTRIGIAIPGLVDRDGRVEMSGVLPRLAGWRPADALAGLGATVHALNDAEAALVEEARDLPPGATAGLVMAGTAIGAAFRVEGQPLRGARGWAGELGYAPIATPEGIRPLDDLAGGRFIAARLGTDGAGLQQRAAAGDAAALAAIRDGGTALGLALAGVVNLLNPHRLVLGGGTLSLPGYEDAVRDAIARHALPPLLASCEIRRAGGGAAVVALGAMRAAG